MDRTVALVLHHLLHRPNEPITIVSADEQGAAAFVEEIKEALMTFKVVTKGDHLEVWASGFYDKAKAQHMIDEGYWHRHMYQKDKHKELEVIPEK